MEPQYKDIEGVRYGVTPLPGRRALLLQPRIAEKFGAGRELAKGITGEDVDVGAILASVEELCKRLPANELWSLTEELLYNATADDKPLIKHFDSLMMGRSHVVWKLLVFAVEVNYRGFFDGLRGLFVSLGEKLQASRSSSATSPDSGPSIVSSAKVG